jgi:hypothetical protein
MRAFRISSLVALSLLAAACSRPVTVAPAPAKPVSQMTPPSPEQMEAAMQKASTPTAEHAFLKRFEGKWNVTTTMWMGPGSKPEVSTGKASNEMALGGKFLKQDFSGSFMKQPFNGVGYTGYDTINNAYTSIWMDTMSTATLVAKGDREPTSNALYLAGEMSCPFSPTGKQAIREVVRLIDKDHHTFEMYSAGPDGKEFKSLEIAYVRSKNLKK